MPSEILGQTLDYARDVPNEWIMSIPFNDSAGDKHLFIVLASSGNPDLALAGVFNVERMVDNLFKTHNVNELALDLKLKTDRDESAVTVLTTVTPAKVVHQTQTLLYTARTNLDLHWMVGDNFDGGTGSLLVRGIWGGGLLLTLLMALFVTILLRQNRQVQQRVEAATRDLEETMAIKNEVAAISLAAQQAASLSECGAVLFSRFSRLIGCRQGMLAIAQADGVLEVVSRSGAPPADHAQSHYHVGEGIVGQCARDRHTVALKQPAEERWQIRSGLGSAAPAEVWIFPIEYSNDVVGVIELAVIKPLDLFAQALLKDAIPVIALRLADLLRRRGSTLG
ncbi:MAG: GAF domain-containing protein [Gammaproteobacteria bacterium]|nr:GAF domain-containing protein [Gammaproteobacteria bacterium]